MPVELAEAWQKVSRQVDEVLAARLPAVEDSPAGRLYEAMRYSALAPGKRLRPLLVVLAGQSCRAYRPERRPLLLVAGAAVEMVHTYSLIHDDLPAMDNDDLRRGLPTCHRQFDEATAILAGDALQAQAFQILSGEDFAPGVGARLGRILSHAAGGGGMVGGQAMDLWCEGHPDRSIDLATLRQLHERKTGAVIAACLAMGGAVAGAEPDEEAALTEYGRNVGLGFQVVDDILDVTADSATLGKTAGKDQRSGKATYVSLLGLDEARREAARLHEAAIAALGDLGQRAEPLRQLARFLVGRAF
ncbi:polyprenyl synthetase family protein [bacterium]|nr:polyprenyl synthetase family protein [bacterium]